MNDPIYSTSVDSEGMVSFEERNIRPVNQSEADVIYDSLATYLSPECVHADGEHSASQAADHLNFYMRKALQVEICGFLPTTCSDVWEAGQKPSSLGLL